MIVAAAILALASGAAGQSDAVGSLPSIPAQALRARIIYQPRPVYPTLAKVAHIQGVVRFAVWIGPDGTVERIHLISGHPFLVQAAMDAVKQWVYRPVYAWGRPIRIVSWVDVTFTLSELPPPAPAEKPTRV